MEVFVPQVVPRCVSRAAHVPQPAGSTRSCVVYTTPGPPLQYKVGHGFLVRVSELCRQNGDSCENKNYGSNLDQFLGNFFRHFLSKIRKFIFHSCIHLSFICDVSILIFHHYAIFLWHEFFFPMSTIKLKSKHQVTLQLRKCSCMILALPVTFNELYHGSILFNLFKNLEMNAGMKNEFSNFREKFMEKVTKKLIQIAPKIFIFTTITVLTAQLANPY
eukprot:sb/3469928/